MSDAEVAAREHARRIVVRDPRAREDLAPAAELEPPDLFDRLLEDEFADFELVGHARIGAHHVFKTKYVGSRTVVVQARWAPGPDNRWQIRGVLVARVSAGEE